MGEKERISLIIFKKTEPDTFSKVARAIGQINRVKKKGITYFHIKWEEAEESKKRNQTASQRMI